MADDYNENNAGDRFDSIRTLQERVSILEERVKVNERTSMKERAELRGDILGNSKQVALWMDEVRSRLPPWVTAVISALTLAVGSMAMWILTHK